MSNLLARLKRDHVNFERLDALLEQQAALMDRGEMADFGLLSDLLRYMAIYPSVSHHPVEDLILAKLLDRAPEAATMVTEIEGEHQRLKAIGRSLGDLIAAVLGGGITPLDKLRGLMWEYLQLSRRHVMREETEVFPQMDRVLRAEDWQELEETLSASTDPLFGEVVDHSYQALYEAIERRR